MQIKYEKPKRLIDWWTLGKSIHSLTIQVLFV